MGNEALIEKWQYKHSKVFERYINGRNNNDGDMELYRSRMVDILEFIEDLKNQDDNTRDIRMNGDTENKIFEMKELYYCEFDESLFWIVGYYPESNTSAFAEWLIEKSKELAEISGCDYKQITFDKIQDSMDYKGMYVFSPINPTKIPYNAFRIHGNQWNMWKWIAK